MRELVRIILIGLWESVKQTICMLIIVMALWAIAGIALGLVGIFAQIAFWSIAILVVLFLIGADKEGI